MPKHTNKGKGSSPKKKRAFPGAAPPFKKKSEGKKSGHKKKGK